MIKVLQLVASSRGGGAVHVRDLTRHLDSSRFTVTVAMPEDGGHVTAEDFTDYAVPFRRLDIASGPNVAAVLSLRRMLKQSPYDILHCHGSRAAFYGRVAAALLGSSRPRTVYTIHGFAAPHYGLPRRTILLGVERLLASLTEAVICVSEPEREDLLAVGLVRPERLYLVRYGIDIARFRDAVVDRAEQRTGLGVPIDAPLVTTVCRLYRPRDFDTLLTAFAAVLTRHRTAHLLIVGDGPYRPQVEALISRLGLSHNVTLAGFRRDVPQILAMSDIFVLSTALWEGLPLTVLEAMSSGLPVVASDVGGIREEVIHEETGLIVQPKKPVALSEALLYVLSDPLRARAMGQKGLNRAQEAFTLERMGRETTAIYMSLIT